jgi:MutS-like protein
MTGREWYSSRIAHWSAEHRSASAHAIRLSRWRLVAFLGGVAVLWWGARHGSAAAILVAAAAFIAFAWLVSVHARVLLQLERCAAARGLSELRIARLERDWGRLPEMPQPDGLDLETHPYAGDLDLFGHASISTWLGTPATRDGTRYLWRWLLTPSPPEIVADRQRAIEDLAPRRDWRESFAIHGALARVDPVDLTRFLDWAESAAPAVPLAMRVVAPVLTLAIWVLLLLSALGAMADPWWLVPVVVGVVLSYVYSSRIYAAFDRAALGERALPRYASLLSLVCREQWNAPSLQVLQQRLRAGSDAPRLVRRLAHISEWSELRTGAALLHFPIQAVTLWDFHVLFALERWRARFGSSVRGWLDALGDVDALSMLAAVRADESGWTLPQIDADAETVEAESIGHPLIAPDRRIDNDVRVGPTGTVLVITGSNMSGKSTLLRAIGLNVVLAQAGAPVCARSFRMPRARLYTSIRVQDSLERGQSYFMAALARLKLIVDAAESRAADGGVLLYLLDEVLQGTNSVERGVAVRAIARHLLDAGAIGAMTTHDLAIAREEPLASRAQLVHFTEQVHPDGTMTFDYRLRPGLATSTNAIRLMQLIGIQPR